MSESTSYLRIKEENIGLVLSVGSNDPCPPECPFLEKFSEKSQHAGLTQGLIAATGNTLICEFTAFANSPFDPVPLIKLAEHVAEITEEELEPLGQNCPCGIMVQMDENFAHVTIGDMQLKPMPRKNRD
jgi:hypothetical protein